MQVKQIVNLFELMELFVRAKKPLSVKEIIEEFDWPRSSAFNIVSTMVDCGYLYQPVSRGGYYPTARWMDLARDISESQPLPESVHDLIVDLVKLTGETVTLTAPDGTQAVVLDAVQSPAVIRYTANPGDRVPVHLTAAGKAILAQYSPSERAALLSRVDYRSYVPGIVVTAETVEQDIRDSAVNGWYVNVGNYDQELVGIGVPFPIRNRRNAIVLGAPRSRVQDRIDELGSIMKEAVARYLGEGV